MIPVKVKSKKIMIMIQGGKMKLWKCDECHVEVDHLEIVWGDSGGQKVDVIDYFCPNCGTSNQLTPLPNTKKEREEYWDKEWSK